MKIVQSFWSGGAKNFDPLLITGGWYSAEYHWMSTALSANLLRRYYDKIELVTDELGYQVLIEQLKLPYTSVRVELNKLDEQPPIFWGLAKIYAQSIQKEPFLHVDNDVFIFDSFAESLLNNQLIVQNLEYQFPMYKKSVQVVTSLKGHLPHYVPTDSIEYYAYNAGIIGGCQAHFFDTYYQEALTFVERNQNFIRQLHARDINMFMEQCLLYYLAQHEQISVGCQLGDQPITDVTYPGLSNFEDAPVKQTFLHAMGQYKRNTAITMNLGKRLRCDFPNTYYAVLKLCRTHNGPLANPTYEHPALSITAYDSCYFNSLKDAYNQGNLTRNDQADGWTYFYAKQMSLDEQVDFVFNLAEGELLQQLFCFDDDAFITEHYESVLCQTLHFINVHALNTVHMTLDSLNMVLLDAFHQKKTIQDVVQEIAGYYNSVEIQQQADTFQNLVIARIRELLSWGAIKWLSDSEKD
ncbi:hypothetical protein CLV58_113111 [Spirosoma oryzae]|uniref:DUF6734 domain-containing protein n=1 Tax=Spirosoma oryzae TaxID=1469603 RepID=A0A2T0SRE8_9BACT|nr:DUF6734 family protein [Spirosoma oryzae]PRY35980.1 hypothetical protein CLV58_113111 [Spirosoma oryzae]